MRTLPPPDILATDVDPATLVGTARSIATAALKAGYTIRATRALGPRIPRQPSQNTERVSSLALIGVMGNWTFTATHTVRDGWDVVIHRPGWPPQIANTVTLTRQLKAQTPADPAAETARERADRRAKKKTILA